MEALDQFIDSFLGYGNLQAPLWFVGMEEGGGQSLAELSDRLRAWDQRGRQPCEDLAGYHRAIGVTQFFDLPHPKLQTTWCALMKALQAWRGGASDLSTLRTLQASELGTLGGPVALLELLPLPAPRVDAWPYRELAEQRPYLADRSRYVAHLLPRRIERLRAAVRLARPQAVVCYGMGYASHWETVSGGALSFRTIGGRRCLFGSIARTQFLVVPHPSRANATQFWTSVGAELSRHAL